MKCFHYLRSIQDKLADSKSPCEKYVELRFNGPVMPFGAEILFNPISTTDKNRLRQCGTKRVPGRFIRHALNCGGGWTEDLIIAIWYDIGNDVASEVDVHDR